MSTDKIAQLEHELEERNKELKLLYGFSKVIEDTNLSKEDIAKKLINLIPPAWQFPEVACASIILHDQEFKSENFKESKWKQSSDILAAGEKIGLINVYYKKEMPEFEEGPFLNDERLLIDSIAERVGNDFDRMDIEEVNKAQSETLLELSSPIS